MSRVLVLRPEPGAARTVARARALGLEALSLPLFVVRPRSWDPPIAAGFDAVMMTSANAARLGGPALARYRRLPLYAVGAATASMARAAGFGPVIEAGPTVEDLARRMEADGRKRILDLGGLDRTPFDAGTLTIERRVLYAAEEATVDRAAMADAAADAALLHSARAARRLRALVDPAKMRIAAISGTVADAAGPGWRAVAIAATPDDAALLAAAAALCDQQGLTSGGAG